MMIPRLATVLLTLCALASAQTATFDLPTFNPVPQKNNYPFAGSDMRYQQWYSAREWQARTPLPVRVVEMAFKASGVAGGQAGRVLDLEVRMANGPAVQPFGSFASNMVSGETIVFPRQSYTMAAAVPGSYPVRLVFAKEFVWDGVSGVVVDIKLFNNGNQNIPYPFDLESTVASQGRISRLYTINDPNSAWAAKVDTGQGITTQFVHKTAITAPFGAGCAGTGGLVPVASTSGGLPVPGSATWAQELSDVVPNTIAFWMIGVSRTMITNPAVPLPLDLSPYGGSGCSLLVDPMVSASVRTGMNGTATLPLPLPPVTQLIGFPFYSQWLALDAGAANGVLAVSNGLTHVLGWN